MAKQGIGVGVYASTENWGAIVNHDAMLASYFIDGADDERWFAEHPEESVRVRKPSYIERDAMKLPADVEVHVVRTDDDKVFRKFTRP